MPRFRLFMEDVATRSRAMEGSGVAPLKSMYVRGRNIHAQRVVWSGLVARRCVPIRCVRTVPSQRP